MPIVDSVESSSGLFLGKKSRPSELTQLQSVWHYALYSIVEMWRLKKVPEDSIWKRWKNYLCISGPMVDGCSWFRWKKFRFVDRKKIQTVGNDPIMESVTLYVRYSIMEMWLVRKVQEDSIWKRWKNYLCISGQRVGADSWFRWKQFAFVHRRKIQTIGTDQTLKVLTLCDIALYICGLWEKFQKIRFGRDGKTIYAFPVRG